LQNNNYFDSSRSLLSIFHLDFTKHVKLSGILHSQLLYIYGDFKFPLILYAQELFHIIVVNKKISVEM